MTLPRGWALAALPDLIGQDGLITDGDWVESKDQDAAGSIRLTQLADIGDGYFKDRSRRFLRPDQAQRLGCTQLKQNDVLIARMPDPLGRACLFPAVGQDAVTVVDTCIVRVNDGDIEPRWLMHFINAPQFRTAVVGEQRGSTRKRISKKSLCELSLPVPPFPEQVRIADEADTQLSRIDAAIQGLERAEGKLKAYRTSALKAAVEGRLVPTDAELARKECRSYEAADVLLECILKERRRRWEEVERAKMNAAGRTRRDDKWKARYEEPPVPDCQSLPELPEGWLWVTMGQLIFAQQNGLYVPASSYGVGVPILRIDDYQWDASRSSSELKQVDISGDDAKKYGLRTNDIVLNRVNSMTHLGKAVVISGRHVPAVFESNMMRIELLPGISPHFVQLYLSSSQGRSRLTKNAKWAVNQASINQADVASCVLPLPPLAEQLRIVAEVERLLSVAAASADALTASRRRCAALRRSVLAWAFAGKLVDRGPSNESAHVLLARIRAEREAAAPTAAKARRPRKLKAAS